MTGRLDLEIVDIVDGTRVAVDPAAIDALEATYGCRFPSGYREYLTRLGEGSLNALVRIYPPWRVPSVLQESRDLWSKYWFWQSANVPLDQGLARAAIPVGDTIDGDTIVFHPADPDLVIVLPRNRDRLYARRGLLQTIEWICSGGVLHRFGPGRTFQPFDSRLTR